ncbi:unnamed protein product [Aphanomyces euteiches]|uniref:Uncharacterized protein n=1 Tax=Aphanomyces euteiches TaxID=100861 RepID=A0A6G0XU72_9STRA|nr:hypothetical protein Ae201684_001327 [Aphanomyces euteiches]KAH9139620.1 hypothetical protein AeRB84_016097 [Aphanomyces euteiches]
MPNGHAQLGHGFHRSREDKIRDKADTDGPILDLSNAYLGDDGCADIVRILRQYPRKTVLDLRGNRIQADGACILAAMLKTNVTLVHVNLEWNCIGVLDHGMEALASALALNTALTCLDLRNNSIGPDGAILLAQTLRRNRTLEELDLRWNDIGSSGGSALLDMLEDNSTLRRLHLLGNNVSIAITDAIYTAIKRNEQSKHHHAGKEYENNDEDISSLAPVVEQDDSPHILLEYMADKERLAAEITALKKQMELMESQVESRDSSISQLERELQLACDERDRWQQRDAQGRQQIVDTTARLEQCEAKRKQDLDEQDKHNKAMNETLLQLKQDKFELERTLARVQDDLEQAQKQSAQEIRLLEVESVKMRAQWQTSQDEVARLREQVADERKEANRRETHWQSEIEAVKQATARRAEMAIELLEQQLRHATSQVQDLQTELQAQRERAESLQSQLLELKVAHEAQLGDVTAKMEKECQERMERTVASVEAQLEAMRRQRVQLENDLDKHRLQLDQMRDDKARRTKLHEEEMEQRTATIQQLKAELAAAEEKLANVEMELVRQTRKTENVADRVNELENELDSATSMHEQRVAELEEAIGREKKAQEESAAAAREKQRRLNERIASLEATREAAKSEHDLELQAFATSVHEHVQTWMSQRPSKH